jgi:carbamoyl-phosphate synthase large subunit
VNPAGDSQQRSIPLMIKGRYYEAYKANNVEEGLKYYYEIESRWGCPSSCKS